MIGRNYLQHHQKENQSARVLKSAKSKRNQSSSQKIETNKSYKARKLLIRPSYNKHDQPQLH